MSQDSAVDTNVLAVERTHLAAERTHLAAERTYFSVLRTGLAVAGAGTVIVSILGEHWPEWLNLLLSGVFIVVGYTMIIVMLNRYQQIVNKLRIEHDLNVMSPRWAILLAMVLQVALAAVMALVLLSLFKIPLPF